MRHKRKHQKLNRNTSQRRALFKGLIQSLIIHEEIKTTQAKAKAIKRLIDKLITKSKTGSLHARRQVMAFLPDKKAANKLFDEITGRFKKQTSGFTRFVRLGKRRGDDAMMVKMEFTVKKKIEEKKSKKGKAESKTEEKPKKGLFRRRKNK